MELDFGEVVVVKGLDLCPLIKRPSGEKEDESKKIEMGGGGAFAASN